MQSDHSILSLLRSLTKWKKTIIYTTAAAFVLSLLISFLIPVYYKAETTFFAANETLASPTPLGGANQEVYLYGTDKDRDRLISISKSSEVISHLVKKFNLYDYYEIDSTARRGPLEMSEKLAKLYKVKKNEYGGVVISVEDTDPQRAANMANVARDIVSETTQSMIKESQKNLIDNYQAKIAEKESLIRITDDTLQVMRERYDIYDTKTQGGLFASLLTTTNSKINELRGKISMANKGLVVRDSLRKWQANLGGLDSKRETLTNDLKQFSSGISEVKKVELELNRYTDQLSHDKERYNQLLAAYASPFTALHIVERAHPPVDKSRPKKSLVVLGSTLITFILLLLGIILLESFRKIPWSEINDPNA